MNLALVGSGEYLPPVDPIDHLLFDLIGGKPKIACLPTAAGSEGPARLTYWKNLAVEHYTRLGASVESLPVFDRTSANNPEMADRIRSSNFIYLSGGKPDYLLTSLKESLVWEAIMDVLEHDGVLAGCSAGAMILGEKVPAFPSWRKAFNLVRDVTIVPHFDEIPSSFLHVMRIFVGRGDTLVGIEGNTALVQVGETFMVVGQGSVTVWNREAQTQFRDGQTVIFPQTPADQDLSS